MPVHIDDESNTRLFRLRHEEVADFGHRIAEIAMPPIQLHAARVTQEVSENVAQPCGFARQGVHATRHAGAIGFIKRRLQDFLAQQLCVQDHGGEWILDFVRKSAGHRSNLGITRALRRCTFGVPHLRSLHTHHPVGNPPGERHDAECATECQGDNGPSGKRFRGGGWWGNRMPRRSKGGDGASGMRINKNARHAQVSGRE